jgi:hypothetical protein
MAHDSGASLQHCAYHAPWPRDRPAVDRAGIHGSAIKSVCLNKATGFPWPVAAWYDKAVVRKQCIKGVRHG